MSEKCNRELGDFYFSVLLKWQTWDVGVNRIPDATKPKGFRLVGDADFESCSKVASAITPVPGGVGPMTITMLLWNTLESAMR